MIVAAGSLYAHAALAAGFTGPQEGNLPLPTPIEAPEPTPSVQPAVYTADAPSTVPLASADEVSPAEAREIECVAKVIRHEAANQPVVGQRAVAQVIRTRMKDGRFPRTACGVVKQAGQFFDVEAYAPSRKDTRWTTAVDVATETLNGEGKEVAQGALFFHSLSSAMPGRTRVTRIADHTFYR